MKNKHSKQVISEQVVFEKNIYDSFNKAKKIFVYSSFANIVLCFLFLIVAILVVTVGKGKDKIVIRNATGKPYLLRVDNPDKIDPAELEVFVRNAVSNILSWAYTDIQDEELFKQKINKMLVFFNKKAFKKEFWPVFKRMYLTSVLKQKLVIKAYFSSYQDCKIRGKRAFVIANVNLHIVKVSESESVGEIQKKLYVLKIKKGGRTIENPYGLYIVGFSEYSD